MTIMDGQVRKLREEIARQGQVGLAALRTGMCPNTARKYLTMNKLPSELKEPRDWITRPSPIDTEDWAEIVARLTDAPELEAKTLFVDLCERKPEYVPGQLRTFQRQVRNWRASSGPEKEIFFSQLHRPGEAGQTDFTDARELGITIQGEPFLHLLCQFVLPYSNWQWATVCKSESLSALTRGVQAAVFHLGRVPLWHQTDNSTAATHNLSTGKRDFNDDYAALMRHLGMQPRTTAIGKKEQNGDVEAFQRVAKSRLKQHLLLRGNTNFESVAIYEAWVQSILERANAQRTKRVAEELDVMRPVPLHRMPEFRVEKVGVTSWSTIRIKQNTYSVPSRLIGEDLKIRVYDERLDVFYRDRMEFSVERLHGKNGNNINYRHIIWSLVRKPGAFERYRYRESLFPNLVFRRTYDRLQEQKPGRTGDIEYLRILHLAASTMESTVTEVLEETLSGGKIPNADAVKARVSPAVPVIPEMARPEVRLEEYDALLEHACAEQASLEVGAM